MEPRTCLGRPSVELVFDARFDVLDLFPGTDVAYLPYDGDALVGLPGDFHLQELDSLCRSNESVRGTVQAAPQERAEDVGRRPLDQRERWTTNRTSGQVHVGGRASPGACPIRWLRHRHSRAVPSNAEPDRGSGGDVPSSAAETEGNPGEAEDPMGSELERTVNASTAPAATEATVSLTEIQEDALEIAKQQLKDVDLGVGPAAEEQKEVLQKLEEDLEVIAKEEEADDDETDDDIFERIDEVEVELSELEGRNGTNAEAAKEALEAEKEQLLVEAIGEDEDLIKLEDLQAQGRSNVEKEKEVPRSTRPTSPRTINQRRHVG
ncbi:hypothetical protein ACHAWF_002252 [Thalassiosira exigua]